ncbi:MAG TPA: YbaK/EbsC family protein [Hyphomicrobiaceae bacterium]|nr:YbaK/EbsC family protein [Hyphomicrobiaceae bacterium]
MAELKPAARRFLEAARAAGLDIEIVTHPRSTRTAEEAAAACGCAVGQIVKSLVFQGQVSGAPILLLVSGANRVDEKHVASAIGETLKRPDAAYVREVTGYAIGGIPPLGHATRLTTFIDRDLLSYETVWAAAGTPDSVFCVAPAALAAATDATTVSVV